MLRNWHKSMITVAKTQFQKQFFSFPREFSKSSQLYSGLEYEPFEGSVDKTTIDLGSRAPNLHPLMLKGYGVGIFKFTHTTIKGSIAVVDKAVFKWNITDPKDITTASLSMFYLVHPKLDLLVIGTGNKYFPVDPSVIKEMKGRGISVEVQDTRNACGTYNLLKSERPELVGAAMVPISEAIPTQKMIHHGRRATLE